MFLAAVLDWVIGLLSFCWSGTCPTDFVFLLFLFLLPRPVQVLLLCSGLHRRIHENQILTWPVYQRQH